jgi:hypothetical protein
MNAQKPSNRDPRSRRPAASRSSNAVRQALRGESVRHEPLLAFERTNWLLMGGGVAAAIVGFVLLARGDTGLAPLLLVAGYCALIPLGIVWRTRARPGGGERGSRANSSAG